jgi:ketosteroid isomerase-like protein
MEQDEMSEIERNKAVARQFIENMTNNNIAAIIESYDDDVKIYTMGNTLISGVVNKTQAKEFAGQVLNAFPQGIKFVIHNLTAEEDRVAIEAESFATHVSGKYYNNKYHFFMRLKEGKVIELKEYMDTEMVTEVLCGGQKRAAA